VILRLLSVHVMPFVIFDQFFVIIHGHHSFLNSVLLLTIPSIMNFPENVTNDQSIFVGFHHVVNQVSLLS